MKRQPPSRSKKARKQYYQLNAARIRKYASERREKLRGTPEYARQLFRWGISSRYGISLQKFNRMLIQQSGRCALCGQPMMRKQEPCIDHAHIRNGRVRGLLCTVCNTGLGWFERNDSRKIAAYIAQKGSLK